MLYNVKAKLQKEAVLFSLFTMPYALSKQIDQFWRSMIPNDWLTINKGTFVKVGQKQVKYWHKKIAGNCPGPATTSVCEITIPRNVWPILNDMTSNSKVICISS